MTVVALNVIDPWILIFLKMMVHITKQTKKPAPARDIKRDRLLASY
jgi:hypothetical protein